MVFKIKLKLGEVSTNHLQTYYSLIEVAGALFGGKKKDKPINVDDLTPEAAVKGLNDLFAAAGNN